ncbi:kinase-associated lipoprotein B [Jeotgalibacillus sp. R-1-5s-1]|uniref:kinase-associated lipoprotein B n=1 Tax=Jeotgalibacillus sp. R-1-5s-1 TaxID=2555897 RepID=UPI00106CCC4C|nr:kinase-associated lipoprotein B [Jeotgalibacillus sp. R-1-5s-1]TFD95945.1 kinase [Jeotgalibacillus sp. R-1-5s-1]
MTEYVKAFYKTGAYIGVVTEDKDSVKVVQIKDVLKHPIQGDLHNPNQVDVPLFHERKALAFNERANIPSSMVKPFDGEPGDYYVHLAEAVAELERRLQEEDSAFNQKSLEALAGVKKEYELMYNMNFS